MAAGYGRPCWSIAVLAALAALPAAASAADYHVCDCDAEAAAGCVPGDDAADGTSPATAWRTYEQARSRFGSLAAGDAILFCRGGAFVVGSGSRWVNTSCTAALPCRVADYAPAWGSGAEGRPIVWVRSDANAFALEDGGDAEHEEGYVFRNLELRCTAGAGTDAQGFFLYNDIDDVTIDNVSIDGFGIGVHQAGSNACNAADPECDGRNDRLTVRNSRIVNCHAQGYLGAGDDTVLEGCYFENNGTRPVFDHNIYVSGAAAGGTRGIVVRGNELYRSSVRDSGSCEAVSLVVHGVHEDLTIEGNLVREDVGAAGQGCWGIAVDGGYDSAESFTRVAIRGNTVRNVGNVGIGVSSCVDCTIENNVVVHEQDFGITALAVPDRDRGTGDAETTGAVVRNNSIWVGAGGGTGVALRTEGTGHLLVSNAIHFAGADSWSCLRADLPAASYAAIDYNACWFPAAGGGRWEATAGALAAWQAASGFDEHSRNTDPGFAAPAGPDWDLAAAAETAAIVDSGDPARSAPTDFFGAARGTAPDMGAFEHGGTPPVDAGTDGDADGDGDAGGDAADADADVEAATEADASVDAEASDDAGDGGGDDGCGCAVPGSRRSVGVLSLLLVGGLLRCRRRGA
ncbi:MAG: right-handed parallel beta-helix repeat-containing protein [Deltaproteobacteria bacterium]|nr:right-handed parallel beta-helix repeat-containing protein [Deltaproteobacteria bacterium]